MKKRKSVFWSKIPKWIIPYLKRHKLYHKYAFEVWLTIPYKDTKETQQN
jgi:hypothetical protein